MRPPILRVTSSSQCAWNIPGVSTGRPACQSPFPPGHTGLLVTLSTLHMPPLGQTAQWGRVGSGTSKCPIPSPACGASCLISLGLSFSICKWGQQWKLLRDHCEQKMNECGKYSVLGRPLWDPILCYCYLRAGH